MQLEQYKITNCTKWPGAKKGKHRIGFIVQINRKHLKPSQYMYIDAITEGIENMQRKRYIQVEEVKNRRVEIKDALKQQEEVNAKERKRIEEELALESKSKQERAIAEQKRAEEEINASLQDPTPASGLDKDEMRAAYRQESKAQISQGESYGDPLDDLEQPTDTGDSFTVKAGKNKNKNKNRN